MEVEYRPYHTSMAGLDKTTTLHVKNSGALMTEICKILKGGSRMHFSEMKFIQKYTKYQIRISNLLFFLSVQIWYISFVFRRNHCWNQIPGWVKKALMAKSFRKEFLKKLEKGHFRMYNMYISEQSFLNLFFIPILLLFFHLA